MPHRSFPPPAAPHHLLSVSTLDRAALDHLFDLADRMQVIARRQQICKVLDGAVLANLFFEASTRTRLSFGAAFCRLGGSVIDTTGMASSSLAKGETLADTARVVSGYADAIVMRHPDAGSVAELATGALVPVINGGDGAGEHPTQALLDVYTMAREFAPRGMQLERARIALVGDLRYGRTVHSLSQLLMNYRGVQLALVSPSGLEMPEPIVAALRASGMRVDTYGTLAEGLGGADVIYATRIQRERLQGEALDGQLQALQINRAALDAHAKPTAIVMHPLPRDSRPGAFDLSSDLDGDERLAIFRQTDNGVAVRMALFAQLMGVEHDVSRSLRDAPWCRR